VLEQRARDGDPDAVARLRALYDAALAQCDAMLVRPLLEKLDGLGLAGETYVVILSDHGEAFGEHGDLFHGKTLWSEVLHVPWLLRGPGVPAGRRIADTVSLVDVAPTLAELLGLPPDERTMGQDVGPGAPAGGRAGEPFLLHLRNCDDRGTYEWDGLVQGEWKLLRRRAAGEAQAPAPADIFLYHFFEDPCDRIDIKVERREASAQLVRRLERELETAQLFADRLPSSAGDPALFDAAIREMLARLGYVR